MKGDVGVEDLSRVEKIVANHKVLANRLKRMKRNMKRMKRNSIDVNILKDELASCERRLSAVWKGSVWDYMDDDGASALREENELTGQIDLLKRLIKQSERGD